MRRSAPALSVLLTLAVALTAGCGGPSPTVSPVPTPVAAPAAATTPTPEASRGAMVGGSNAPSPSAAATVQPAVATLAQLVGQKLVVTMDGTVPSAALLGRVRRGEVGGVIIFGRNIKSAAGLKSAVASLQAAAHDGGNPPLLVMADQEGGAIRTLSWAPPSASAVQMGSHSAVWIRAQGAAAGSALKAVGINVDLAPVADVPSSPSSFMYLGGRTFSFSASRVAADTVAFAQGLRSQGVLATGKHFPGLGRVKLNTDRHVQTVTASKSMLAVDLLPYKSLLGGAIGLVMLSNATYSAYDKVNAAGWSRAIGVDLLRGTLGWRGVTITDSLDGTAHSRGVSEASLAVKAALASTDLLLLTGSESTTAATFNSLLARAKSGVIPTVGLEHSYARILALKASIAP